MKPIKETWFKNAWFKNKAFVALLLTTSVCTPLIGNAAEVSAFSDVQNIHIRQLAASCAACHGTQGNSVAANSDDGANAVLAGMASTEFTEKMLGFKDGSRKATVMHHHAKGLTVDEINQLAVHFSQQKRVITTALKSQTLKADHE
ncbi:c-type cytochrome [Methylotenera versatilis]|uniref:Cytochrome c class I n=1 Tax=Methylotenera versatilis (strain 301) TaxID=666681 RepID=D7DPD1_METV0|nr:class I cytochrome c [Methylotenera versatilis]ADI29175.1 cytochrome c class I [Methylotenera versatilis 301]